MTNEEMLVEAMQRIKDLNGMCPCYEIARQALAQVDSGPVVIEVPCAVLTANPLI